MDHLHFETEAGPRDTFEVKVDRPANVYLMDDANYQQYCAHRAHMSFGGFVDKGTQILKPNRKDRWHIVVDMGRSGGLVSASVVNKTTGQPVGKFQSQILRGAPNKAT